MHGKVENQVKMIYFQSGIKQIGESKHEAKAEARGAGAKTWHQVGKQLGIHSYGTADTYRQVWRECFNFVKEHFKVYNIEKLSGEHVKEFLQDKVEKDVKYSTFQKDAAAIEKLETALNMYSERFNRGNTYNFSDTIKDIRQEAKETLERFTETRAYENPGKLVNSVVNEQYKIIAAAQHSGGFRISELNQVKPDQFLGDNKFQVIKGKGGLDRVVEFRDSQAYENFRSLVENNLNPNDKFSFNKDEYRNSLKEAAARSDQDYTGSHGLRWNYAQESFAAHSAAGDSYEEALSKVSRELGHSRPDITEHYLKGAAFI